MVLLTLVIGLVAGASTDSQLPAVILAQKQALNRDRKGATSKLIEAIKQEKQNQQNKRNLQLALKEISETFFTDKGQRLFETGQAALYDNADLAISKFRQSLDVEDGNISVLLGMARGQLMKKDCAATEATLKQASQINPFDENLKPLRAKALLCLNRLDEALELAKTENPDDAMALTTYAAIYLQNGSKKDFQSLIQKAIAKDGLFPEAHYWLWKTAGDSAEQAEVQGQKYIALCKNLNFRMRQKYFNEPRLCGQTQEVQDALKTIKKNSEP